MSDRIPITQEGFDKLTKELDRLKKEEAPAVIQAISEARSLGDLAENTEYHAARERHSYVQSRIEYLEDRIARSEIFAERIVPADTVVFGCTVRVVDLGDDSEEQYTLVGAEESDPASGKISTSSPIGKALLGKRKGDEVSVTTPGGSLSLKVLDFS